jgi:drug/metabolite transporter (DMT)-like permease
VLAAISRREKITSKKLAIMSLGVVGALLASGIATEQFSNLNVAGIFFALLAGFLYATYLFFKRMRKTSYTPLQGLFNTFMFAAPCTLILGLTLRLFTTNTNFIGFSMLDSNQLLLLTIFAFFSTTLPYGLLNYIKPSEVSPTTEGTILLLDPFLHNVWAIVIFQQYISIIRYFGVGLTLLSAAAMLKIKQKT